MAKPKNKNRTLEESKEHMFLVSPNLRYKDYFITPGKRVNVVEGMYIEYTIVDVRLDRKDSSNIDDWDLSIMGAEGGKLVTLPEIGKLRENPQQAAPLLDPYLDYMLSKYSCVTRVKLGKWGGSGLDHNSVTGWSDFKSYPIFLRDIFGWFTGISNDYPQLGTGKVLNLPDPKHVTPIVGTNVLSVYDDLYQYPNSWRGMDPIDRMCDIAGLEFYSGPNKDQRYQAPHFLLNAMPDYKSDYGISPEVVDRYLCSVNNGERPGVRTNPHAGFPRADKLDKLLFKNGKLLRPEASKYLAPQIKWIPGKSVTNLDNAALRLCSNITRMAEAGVSR